MLDKKLRLKENDIKYLSLTYDVPEKLVETIEETIIARRECREFGEYISLIIGICEDCGKEENYNLDVITTNVIEEYDEYQKIKTLE